MAGARCLVRQRQLVLAVANEAGLALAEQRLAQHPSVVLLAVAQQGGLVQAQLLLSLAS